MAPPAASEREVDLTGGDWTGELEAQIDRIATAWSEPHAWEGTTRMGSPSPVPAPLIGGMVLTEFVVHGWDLARATNRQPQWDGGCWTSSTRRSRRPPSRVGRWACTARAYLCRIARRYWTASSD